MSNTLKMGLKLLLITALATFALALTNIITKEPIQAQRDSANNIARMEVLGAAEEFSPIEVSAVDYPKVLEVYEGLKDGETVGYTLKVVNTGYGDNIVVIVGIQTDGVLGGIRIVQHAETPGLGAKAAEPEFYEQYRGKSAQGQLTDDEISAVTGATVTSSAVTGAVNTAIDYFQTELVSGGDSQ
jgi:electron transport complex protein RnfG